MQPVDWMFVVVLVVVVMFIMALFVDSYRLRRRHQAMIDREKEAARAMDRYYFADRSADIIGDWTVQELEHARNWCQRLYGFDCLMMSDGEKVATYRGRPSANLKAVQGGGR
jgi:hypothetical protein